MTFEKDMVFLGVQEMKFQDGSNMYKLDLFSPNEGSIQVNMGGHHNDVAELSRCSFGSSLRVQFILREYEKGYKLGIQRFECF